MSESKSGSRGSNQPTQRDDEGVGFVDADKTAEQVAVLYVGDEPSSEETGAERLETQHDQLSVHTATSATDGLTHLETNDIDCLVSKFELPGSDGIEFLETVRETYPELPVILFTPKSAEAVASEAIAAGATDHIQNGGDPVHYELLANRIRNAVSRRRSEQRTAQLERQCVELVEETENILCAFSPDMDEVLFMNSAFEELYGIPTDRLCEDSLCFLRATHPDDRLHVEQAINRLQDGQPIEIEHRVNEQAEYERWVRFEGQPIYNDNNEVDRIVGYITEITERRAREHQLRQFKQAIESSGQPFYFTDREGVIEYVNPAFEETTGYTTDDVIGESPRILQSGQHDQSFYEDLWETLRDGETWRGEFINQRKDGEEFVIDQTIAPVANESGKITHFVATSNEITERKAKATKRKQVIDRMTDGIFELDADWQCTLVSEQAAALVGTPRAELFGQHFWDVFPNGRGTTFEEQYLNVMETREPASFVEYNAEFDMWFDVEAYPNSDGGIAIYFRDVTDIKEREHHLELLDRVLRHNLRNNINVIRGRANLIQNQTKNGIGEMAEQIVQTSNELISIAEKERQLVNILQDEPEIQQFNLEHLLTTIESRITAEHPDATLCIDCPDGITTTVCKKFDMAIEELITNAIIHNDSDSPVVTVTVRSTPEAVSIEVADNGPLIPEMDQAVLLPEQERTSLYHGSGLGLSLVRVLTSRSNGAISVNGLSVEGNVIELRVPA
jgi:PAS domain S-box-containing protein